MAVLVIPEVLRRFSDAAELEINIQSLAELSSWLESNHPKLHQVVFYKNQLDKNRMNGFVNLYLEDRAVTHRLAEAIPISQTSSLRLVTSVSGG